MLIKTENLLLPTFFVKGLNFPGQNMCIISNKNNNPMNYFLTLTGCAFTVARHRNRQLKDCIHVLILVCDKSEENIRCANQLLKKSWQRIPT